MPNYGVTWIIAAKLLIVVNVDFFR